MTFLEALLPEIAVVIGLAVVIFIVWKLGKFILRLIFGIITNTILGFIVLFIANTFFLSTAIPLSLSIMLAVALFGLPGVGAIILLHVLGAAV
jgi:SigmaK-factor processing regulatory protein BofA